MTNDFYCDEVLSGKTKVQKVMETENVLAYHHTKPSYPVHIVAIPKRHIPSLITMDESENELLIEMMKVIRKVAAMVNEENGACKVVTNLGDYQESKHLHWHIISGKAN
ncbi:HIT domain-containing protein [Virgibacillus kekensis]|uniref:HIT domain-containing protein n=1 Tax=Virgibacillus kekensis TaxID=202261 RepID=A0ABV9DLF7_9BACI